MFASWLRSRNTSAPYRRSPRPSAWRSRRPTVECLEDRCVPVVFNVNSLADLSIAGGVNPDGTIIGQGTTVTLRSAIQAANTNSGTGGNTINLTLSGTYKITLLGTAGETDNLAGELSIYPTTPNGNLTILNTSGGAVTVNGGYHNRVFDINASDTTNAATAFLVTMQGFTITGGVASDPANPDGITSTGGGIRDQGNQSLTLTNMTVVNNNASADGGGVVMANATNSSWTLTINNSTISDNHSGDAGGGIDTDGAGTVIITAGTVISGNTDQNQGAGIYVDAIQVGTVFVGAPMTMTGTVVSNNQALVSGTLGPPASGGSGGGISNAGNGTMTLTNCTISDNFANGVGGGFSDENNQGSLVVTNCLFTGNAASGEGGAIQEGGPSTTITNSEFRGNVSSASGGAIFANGTTLTVAGSTFVGNTAATGGGAIELVTTGTGANGSTITNSTIVANSALPNATLATPIANGGGIDAPFTFNGSVTLLNDTINANVASAGGGVSWAGAGGSTFTVQNTILARNAAFTSGPDANALGTFTDGGGNLIGISGAGSGNTGFTAASTQTGTVAMPLDPLLTPLNNNGGPTVGAPGHSSPLRTEALLLSSPALDKGVATGAPTVDERGFVRPDLGAAEMPDVGAFEFQDVTLTVTISPTMPTVILGSTSNLAFTVANTSGNALPDDNSVLTVSLAPGPFTPGGSTLTFNVGALAAGQSITFLVPVTAQALGSEIVTASVTSPDTHPSTTSTSTTLTSVMGIKNITNLVSITPVHRHRRGNRRTFRIQNVSGATIAGPVYVVLDNLTQGVHLRNASGFTQSHVTPGDPFVMVPISSFSPGQTIVVDLLFGNPKHKPINFNLVVLAGPGTV
jgi:hypothetical protein